MKRLASAILFIFAATVILKAQEKPKCYVVVGAFKLKQNAENYVGYLSTKALDAKFKLNTHRNLYYVYSYESENREPAKEQLYQVRDNYPELQEAWLYAGDFKGPHIPSDKWEAVANPMQKVVDEVEEGETMRENRQMLAQEDDEDEMTGEDGTNEETSSVSEKKTESPEVGGKWKMYINAVNSTNFKEVQGKFLLFDAERNQQIGELNTHELLGIEDPNNRTNRVRIQSDVFGYHQFEHTFDLDEPEKGDEVDVVQMVGDTIMLNIKLARLRQGDISTLWKVYFYKDAAIMREESVYELNQLLDMLKSNENMEIKIHGHTNGNAHGQVLHLDLDDKQFFTLNGSHEETYASAKKLSLYRAYTIQHWLMDQGITEERIEIKGWGGKKMIYDKFDSQADKNVRVEIEILKD